MMSSSCVVGRDASAIAHAAGIVLAARDINIEYLICQSEKAAAVTEYACGPHHCDRGDLTCSACREKAAYSHWTSAFFLVLFHCGRLETARGQGRAEKCRIDASEGGAYEYAHPVPPAVQSFIAAPGTCWCWIVKSTNTCPVRVSFSRNEC